ncbi:MAG: flagellar biosynthesis anti-sigma factor FlgM [Desulfamplus sp.]|nr:flagellar biosynthesis anti-sigma factor FlgM [Desulfamplus sp.]
MRVQNPNAIFITKAYSQSESSRANKSTPADSILKSSKSDSVTFSNTTLQMQKISSAMEMPQAQDSSRADRINALKESIANGTYAVEPDKIAEGFMNAFSI